MSFLLVALVVAGILIGIAIEKAAVGARRERWREKNASRRTSDRSSENIAQGPWSQKSESASRKLGDAADQLRIVMDADFSIQPLLNRSEARLFRELDLMVLTRNPNWQVMAQVSMGEILRSKDAAAYGCINSKRVDLLLMDDDCKPRHAIEYQGSGHHQGSAAARDAVKKEALRRAGIGYHEVVAGQTIPSDLRRLVERLVDAPAEERIEAETPSDSKAVKTE